MNCCPLSAGRKHLPILLPPRSPRPTSGELGRSITQIAARLYVITVQVEQKRAIERSSPNARGPIVTCAMPKTGVVKAIDRFA
jgi:hypothetical protein